MEIKDNNNKILEGFFKNEDFGLWYKDQENFIMNYDEFVKTADVSKMGDNQLLELYELAQNILFSKVQEKNEQKEDPKHAFAPASEMQKEVSARFAFLGKMRSELEKRHRGKGLDLPPNMTERGL